MYCRTCGKEVSDTASFCKHCGAQTGAPPPQNQELSTSTCQPSPNPEPEQKPIKKKLHWIWKDRIARVVCTVIVLPIVVFIASKFITPPINNPDARLILNATHPYTTVTYEEAFDEYFRSPKWTFVGPNADGNICVEFTGLGLYKDIITEALLQLTIDKASEEISCNYFSANDVSMSIPEAEEFINKIFEPYFIPELANAVPEKISVITDAVYPGTNTTYKEALNAFCDEPKWKFIESEDDKNICAEFTGECMYDESEVNALLQFTFDKEAETFWCNYFSMNDVSQPLIMSMDFLDEMFEPYFIPELVEKAELEKQAALDASLDTILDEFITESDTTFKQQREVQISSDHTAINEIPALTDAENQYIFGTEHVEMFHATALEQISISGYDAVTEGKTAEIAVSMDSSGEQASLLLGRDNPNGMKLLAVYGEYGQNFAYDEWVAEASDYFDDTGALIDNAYVQMSACDLDSDGTKEIIISIGDKLIQTITAVYALDKANPQTPFVFKGSVLSGARVVFSNGYLYSPIGTQGRYEIYAYKNDKLIIVKPANE